MTQHDGKINILLNRIHTLEEKVNRNKRLSRSFNARFLGVAETRGENCLAIVEDILRLKFGINGNNIENAHRVRKYEGRPNQARHIIARFHSRMTRLDLFRTARAKLAQSGIRIVDDLWPVL